MTLRLLLSAACLLAGCAANTPFVQHPPVQYGTQAQTTGFQLELAKRVSYYRPVGHQLRINGGPPIWLEPVGEVTVYLHPGRYEVLCASFSSKRAADAAAAPDARETVQFGYKSRYDLLVREGEIKRLRYLPPLVSERSGEIHDIEK
jgi:hypothetical protein